MHADLTKIVISGKDGRKKVKRLRLPQKEVNRLHIKLKTQEAYLYMYDIQYMIYDIYILFLLFLL